MSHFNSWRLNRTGEIHTEVPKIQTSKQANTLNEMIICSHLIDYIFCVFFVVVHLTMLPVVQISCVVTVIDENQVKNSCRRNSLSPSCVARNFLAGRADPNAIHNLCLFLKIVF
jgi:hypothetical protein